MDIYNAKNTTVVLCCAGMGTRLGIGTTKALVDINGVPLIIRQLELLKEFDDIRIVVGFQAERLIQVVKKYRTDIMFAFNYQYETNGVADSLRKGLLGAREYVLYLDGDILENNEDFTKFLSTSGEALAISKISSSEPIMGTYSDGLITKLSKYEGNVQWPGIARLKTSRLTGKSSHVYDVINDILPLPAVKIRSREIDTQEDYERAIEWFDGGQED